jgi:predicted methyltransferase MtxX (methanogen marker protein 4)
MLAAFARLAAKAPTVVGIGLGSDLAQNLKIVAVAKEFVAETPHTVVLMGTPYECDALGETGSPRVTYWPADDPSTTVVDRLFGFGASQNDGDGPELHAFIRGGLPASDFLARVRSELARAGGEPMTYRTALLETAGGHQFFFAPVGIDEARDFQTRNRMCTQFAQMCALLGIPPNIAVLSGGRSGDRGRDPRVDESLRDAETLVTALRAQTPSIPAQHTEILVEEAIASGANFVLAPDGVSGNLIYRTLVHLGAGKSYGAPYLCLLLRHGRVVIDTSRVAPEFELRGAFTMAAGLASLAQHKRT